MPKRRKWKMKTNVVIQCDGTDTVVDELEKAVREELKSMDVKVSKLQTLDIYFQPTVNETYYRAVDADGKEITGKVVA